MKKFALESNREKGYVSFRVKLERWHGCAGALFCVREREMNGRHWNWPRGVGFVGLPMGERRMPCVVRGEGGKVRRMDFAGMWAGRFGGGG